jgi:hypothetical protein
MLNKLLNYCHRFLLIVFIFASTFIGITSLVAQERLPLDNGLEDYHPSPRYRESESHPLRIFAYVLHPVGWFAREFIFRPFSYFVASDEKRASIFGYRDPHDIRRPLCYSKSETVPNCKQLDVQNTSYTAAGQQSGSANRSEVMDLD